MKRGHVTALAGTAVLLAGAGGCVATADGGSGWASEKETRRLTVEAVGAESPVEVTTANGSVEIRRGDVPDAQIEATVRARTADRLARIRAVSERTPEGVLRVRVEWPDGKPRDGDGCSFKITLPGAHGVDVDTSNGSVTLEHLGGPAVVDTSNGSVTISDHAGPAKVDTSNGRISLQRVDGDARLDTSNGSVSVSDLTGAATIDTSNGSVTLVLAPQATGPFDIDTSNGSVRVEVGSAFRGEVTGCTSNSSVRLSGPNPANAAGKGRASIVYGAGGAPSRISTTNGGVTVAPRAE